MAWRGRGRVSLALLVAAIALTAGSAGAADTSAPPQGSQTLTLRSQVKPRALSVKVRIETQDDSQPAPLERLTVDFGRGVAISRLDFPACGGARYDLRVVPPWSTCAEDAIVGRGKAQLRIQFPEQPAISSEGALRVVNSSYTGENGPPNLYAIALVTQPVSTVIAMPIAIKRRPSDTRLVLEIPKIANGAGSITYLEMTVGKRVVESGERRDLVSTSCPTGGFRTRASALSVYGTTTEAEALQKCAAPARLSRR